MCDYLSAEAARLAPYTPGEQPQDQQYIKLNTNESPFPPSPRVVKALSRAELLKLNLYSDPTCAALVDALARRYELKAENIITGNGSDEILAFAFRAFCGEGRPVAYADITYGFYKAQTALFGLDAHIIPLREDFTLAPADYASKTGTVFIANPNAPTGLALALDQIREVLEQDRDRLVVIDEAYVDFGARSAVSLVRDYDNLVVVQTFSKSRQLAGARLAFAISNPALAAELNTLKFSFNPYSVNRAALAAGEAAMRDREYFDKTRRAIMADREYTAESLRAMGFHVLESKANFIFVAGFA